MPTQVNARVGTRASPKLAAIVASALPGPRSEPERSTSGCRPTMTTPASVLLTERSATIVVEYVSAARVLPRKTSPREHDRVRTVFQVDCRSSLAKMSPATTLAINGNPAMPAKPSTTNGIANPDEWTHRPNSESAGTEDWVLMKKVNANGATRQTTAAARGRSWAVSFETSTRKTAPTPPARASPEA